MNSVPKNWVVYGALAANIGVMVAKFAAAAISGSSALASEAIHSLADCGNELLLLLGLRQSRKRPDKAHPYGYGKELYFWSLIVALVLFMMGGGASIYNGVSRLVHPRPLEISWVSYAVLACAGVFESASLFLGVRNLSAQFPGESIFNALRRSKDPSVFTVVAEDSAAIAGVLVATVGTLLSQHFKTPVFDALASIAVGSILGVIAIFLASESKRLLVGESGSQSLIEDVRRLSAEDPAVRRVGEALSMQLGPDDVLLNLDIEFELNVSAGELPGAIQRLESRIRKAHPEVTRLFIEASSLAKSC